jgi:hypothetical protein
VENGLTQVAAANEAPPATYLSAATVSPFCTKLMPIQVPTANMIVLKTRAEMNTHRRLGGDGGYLAMAKE